MLHMNLLRWSNLIGSLSLDIGQYPVIETSNSGYCSRLRNGRLVTLIKINKSQQKVLSCLFFECSRVVLDILQQLPLFTEPEVNNS